MKKRLGAVAVVLLAISVAVVAYYGLRPGGAPVQYQGWVEADFIFVSPDEVGRIEKMSVREGSTVDVGSPLFTLDDDLQRAAVAENEAAVINAKQAYARADVLLKKVVGTQKAVDDAEMTLRSAQARLNSSKTRLERRQRFSPVAGTIQEVYFRGGEMVDPGRPIVSILPPKNVKVRFFVPETIVGGLAPGRSVSIHCDGCAADVPATLSYISTEAEFTPPIIYSNETRGKLVFMIEARPSGDAATKLNPGQPVSVRLQ